MKKVTLLSVALLSLSVVMAVSSFAWFQIRNNGQLGINIDTQDGLEIFFSQNGTVDEAMMPAKLKKGVVSDEFGSIDEGEVVPKDRKLLPKINNDYEYELNGNDFISQSEYIDYPASIVYNQFELNSNYNELVFTFMVRYYNVDDSKNGDIKNLSVFKQTDALTFNFFVMNQKLTNEELDIISTIKGEANRKVPVEKYLSNKAQEDSNFALKNGNQTSNNLITPKGVEDYRLEANGNKDTGIYTVDVTVPAGTKQYLLIESFYSLPDALIEGNLPLTGKFVIDISYDQKIS